MSPKLIESQEWTNFAPAFMQLVSSGPGVAPAQEIAEQVEKLLSFSYATTIVDMGCGPGQITNAVLEKYSTIIPPGARLLGADSNEQMLGQYSGRKDREIASGHTYWSRAETVLTDIHDCNALEDNSISHMLASFVVFLVPEPAKAVQAMKRVLAPGGIIAISSWRTSEWQDLMYYPKKVRPDLVMPVPPTTWTSQEGVREQLEAAGFKDIKVVEAEGYMPFQDYGEICRFILTKLPLAARVIQQMTDEEVLQTFDLMKADLQAKYPSLPAKMVGKATIAYARK
ncbi:S-adenosyl-L-methionine-dependent methyltransferase [Xylaria sp. CBS 124048]|nr:S-adenosyl-L-methionine-dependent methyltransferase [Xylaria sp. CBS 124048]